MSDIRPTGYFPGRFTAQLEPPFVVFLIGARLNSLRDVAKLVPVNRAMSAMQRELLEQPEFGCLHIDNWVGRTTISVQYWRSYDQLEAYARNTNAEHLPAWRDFNRRVRDGGAIGVWHETYHVAAHEAIYVNMPRSGLAQAGAHVEIGAHSRSRERMLSASSQLP
jgi:hypothetical protein